MKRHKKILLTIIITSIILLGLGLSYIGNYFYNLALNPSVSKDAVFGEEEEVEVSKEASEGETWINNVNRKEVKLKSYDDLKLNAYEIENPNESNKWAIVIHGYTGQALDLSRSARRFYDMGYNVLMPDLRGHGKSEGNYIGMGWHDRLDIIDCINYIVKKNNYAEIALYGISMGGATVMMTTGEELPSNVKVAIEDCGYTSAKDEFSYQLKRLYNLPSFPIINVANIYSKIIAGYDLNEASAIEQVKNSKIPTLFIHGSEDDFVPFYMLQQVYEAAECEKEILIIDGAEHGKSLEKEPEIYWNKIEEFIKKYIE